MKRRTLSMAGAALFLSAFTACTEDVETTASNELREIIATAENFIPETESRAFSLVNNQVEFSWADGDTIGIFPNEGAQAYFPILVGSEDSNSAGFTGGGWALKASSTYAAYYPFIGDFYMKQAEIPVSYVGQKQSGNASMTHLSAYDYMAASASTPNNGRVNFQFKHLGAFVQLQITMPQGGTLSSVTLSADEAVFATEGIVDLTVTTPTIKAVTKSKTLPLDVENVTTTAENPVATLYLMLPPVDMTGKALSAIVKQSNGSSETITLQSKNFEVGKAYGLSGSIKDPNGGATAGDGTYKDGVVSVDVAGNMKKLLGSDYLNITSLKVVGPINGDDIYYLRKMLGASSFSEADWGKLTTLDLSEATIVEGGEWYYSYSSSKQYYTSNNVIGDYMFKGCANLKNIVLPNSVTSIGKDAFYWCNALTSVIIGSGVTSIGDQAFYNCDALTSITISDSFISIGEKAFYDCDALKEATILGGSIGNQAFRDCSTLTSATIGNSVTLIGSNAFQDCKTLVSVTIIGNGATSIGSNAFFNCDALTSITIGDGVASIDKNAFSSCVSLTSVTISDLSAWCNINFGDGISNPLSHEAKLYLNDKLLTELIIPEDVTKIKDIAFRGCSSIEKVIISDNVTSIGSNAFYDCDALTSIVIPDNITSIGYAAFYDCDALTSVTIGNGVTKIDSSAFYDCDALTSVIMGNGVPWIGKYAFYNCNALTSVSIGSSVTSINDYAFYNCNALSEFYCYATTPPSLGYYDVFNNIKDSATLYVPARCGVTYKSKSGWSKFSNIIEMD